MEHPRTAAVNAAHQRKVVDTKRLNTTTLTVIVEV
jgi:hypothetical protein